LLERLGSGAFGDVHLGRYRGFFVAVKTMLPSSGQDSVTDKEIEEFRAEADLMKQLTKLEPHDNVLRLVGVITKSKPVAIVTEFCANGSVDVYLKKHTIGAPLKTSMELATARGVRFLHGQHIIHRDLAVRNLLMDEDFVVKVADFGMSRAVADDAGVTKTEVGPLRYMAPESMKSRVYGTQTDAWSFGVTVWEIESNGLVPYSGMAPTQVALGVCVEGLRLQKPSETTDELYALMSRCWSEAPEQRPTFDEIVTALEREQLRHGDA